LVLLFPPANAGNYPARLLICFVHGFLLAGICGGFHHLRMLFNVRLVEVLLIGFVRGLSLWVGVSAGWSGAMTYW